MSAEEILYNLFLNKMGNAPFNGKKLAEGVRGYVRDNGLNNACVGTDEKTCKMLVETYVEPIFRLSADYVRAYFENYEMIVELNAYSNEILELAVRTHNGENMKMDNDAIEGKLTSLARGLYKEPMLKSMVDMQVSEGLLDIAYINGKSDKMSMRLSRRVNVK